MTFRGRINANQRPVIAGILIVIVLGLLYVVVAAVRPGIPAGGDAKVFFTTDDGVTLVSGSATAIPPTEHAGKPAVRAYVFTADGGKHQWVQYLQKYDDHTKRNLEQRRADKAAGRQVEDSIPISLVKKPGDAAWIPDDSRGAQLIMQPTPPPGMGDGPIEGVAP